MREKRHFGKTLFIGAFTGAVNGFFGAGGGTVLIPLLQHSLGVEEKRSYATSVAVISVLSVFSAAVYFLRGALVPQEGLPYLLGGLVGGLLAGKLFGKASPRLLHRLFALLLLFAGVRNVL